MEATIGIASKVKVLFRESVTAMMVCFVFPTRKHHVPWDRRETGIRIEGGARVIYRGLPCYVLMRSVFKRGIRLILFQALAPQKINVKVVANPHRRRFCNRLSFRSRQYAYLDRLRLLCRSGCLFAYESAVT